MVKGKCGRCGKDIIRSSPVSMLVLCDCYRYCPLCGAEMTPYTPDLDPKTYNITGEKEGTVETLYVCFNHTPPYYSSQKPVEVLLE